MNEEKNNSTVENPGLDDLLSKFSISSNSTAPDDIPIPTAEAVRAEEPKPQRVPTPYDSSRARWTRNWTFDEPIYQYHKKLLSEGKCPEEIPHSRLHASKCACAKCKEKRHAYYDENFSKSTSGNSLPDITDSREVLRRAIFDKAFSEKMCGKIMIAPDKAMRIVFSLKGAPEKILVLFDVPPEMEKFYGETLKALLDYYFELPEFEHAPLVFFILTYILDRIEMWGLALAAYKTMEKK